MRKFAHRIIFLGGLLVTFLAADFAQAAQELGIDRSNLSKENEATEEKTLKDIHDLHAMWFRDVLNAGTPQQIDSFVNELKLVKRNDMKMLVNVLPAYADYDEGYAVANAGPEFQKHCGWSQGSVKLSDIRLEKFTQHFRAALDAVKAANLTIDAFEIGNEFDSVCFNGDVPNGHAASDAELMTAVRAYGEFLKAAALIIRDPHYFPHSKIITFGIAHGSDRWDNPPHHISNPARIVAMLRNVKGFNYLDNAQYHVDGYGTHIYPWAGDTAAGVRATLEQDVSLLGRDEPIWVTEWGYLDMKAFPNQKGQTLSQCMQEFLNTFDSLASSIPLGPVMFYSYNRWLVDDTGKLLPQAAVLSAYGAKR